MYIETGGRMNNKNVSRNNKVYYRVNNQKYFGLIATTRVLSIAYASTII